MKLTIQLRQRECMSAPLPLEIVTRGSCFVSDERTLPCGEAFQNLVRRVWGFIEEDRGEAALDIGPVQESFQETQSRLLSRDTIENEYNNRVAAIDSRRSAYMAATG